MLMVLENCRICLFREMTLSQSGTTIMQLLLSALPLIAIVVLEISFHVISYVICHVVPWTLRKRPDGTFSYGQMALQFAIFGPLILLSLVAIGYAIVDFLQRVRAA